MKLTSLVLLVISLFYTTACSTSGAAKNSMKNDAPTVKRAKYDRDYAAMLSGACTTCHVQGVTTPGIPTIHGADKEMLFVILKAFKGSKEESGTMEKIAKTFSDEELELMSYYFAEQK